MKHFFPPTSRIKKVTALGETLTPVVSVMQSGGITAESLSPDTKLILDEISRWNIKVLSNVL